MQAAPLGQSSASSPHARAWTTPGRSLPIGLVVSLLAHWVIVRSVPEHHALRDGAQSFEQPVTIEPAAPGEVSGPASGLPRDRDVVVPGGSEARDNVDALRRGGGGEATGAVEVAFLVTESAPITLVDAPLNAADRSQLQRIDTAADRASWDDRRATPHPEDDPFLASGAGEHRERRDPSSLDAREGARVAPRATVSGDLALGRGRGEGRGAHDGPLPSRDTTGAPAPSPTPAELARGGARGTSLGAAQASPGRGIVAGQGAQATERARVATGRPSVDLGPAATVAEREGRVRDDTDAELLAAQLFESRADASRRAGARDGDGRGGTVGAAGEGSGEARGVGGHAAPYGPGQGAFAALDTSDARYRTWLLAQRRRIEERLVFPRPRQLARDQGTSVVRVVIRRDGSSASAPRVIRSSGFEDLDGAALAAVRDSLPFGPIPLDLAVGHREITVTLPIEFANPMVD